MSLLKASSTPTMLGRKPHLRFRWLVVACALVAIFFFHPTTLTATSLLGAKSRMRLPTIFEPQPEVEAEHLDDLSYLKNVLGRERVTSRVSYASRTIRYIPDAPDRPSITQVDGNLVAEPFRDVEIGKLRSLPESSEIEVHVKQSTRPEQVDASSLIFGCSTTYGRFSDERISPISEWVRWLTDGNGRSNGAGLVLSLFEASQSNIDDAAKKLTSLGISATVVASNPGLDMPGRYVALVDLLYRHPTRDSRKYFILLDDDTFFPAMSDLVETLSHYDHEKPYYIGTFTERAQWLLEHQVPYAFGGGGIILTKPLVKQVSELPCLETKDGRYVLDSDEGDRLLYNCIHKFTETEVTYLPVLHQEDQYGDGSGFYESGTKPLSLHHYKSWHAFIPGKAHIVVDACGEDCLLQRFQFKDDFILSNGYSVAHYPQGIDFDPGMMEGTFDMGTLEEMSLSVAYTFGSLRKSLSGTGKKKSWIMVDSRREGPGQVRKDDQRWLAEGEPPPQTDSVLVLTWSP
jgi:hypothetical protein